MRRRGAGPDGITGAWAGERPPGHNSDVSAEHISPSATVGARVMAAIILVAGIALLTSGTIVWVLGQQTNR